MADESIAMVLDDINENVKRLTITWSCATGAATIVATDTDTSISSELFGMWAFMAVINPGATAPTASYDVVLNDTNSVAIFGSSLEACHTTASEQFFPLLAGTAGADGHYGPRLIDGAITFDITNNSNNAANGVVYVYLSKNK